MIGGAAIGAVGGVTTVAGGVILLLGTQAYLASQDPDAFQEDAIAAAETANLEFAVGGALVGVGVVAVAGGVAMALLLSE